MALPELHHEHIKPMRFGKNNLVICNRPSVTARIKEISDKIQVIKDQNAKPSYLRQNTMYAVQKHGFWYRVMLKKFVAAANKGIVHFLDCDGLMDIVKINGKYQNIVRITDKELVDLEFGQIKVMIHGISKYDQSDPEIVHFFNELLKEQYVTTIYVPLCEQFNRVHEVYVGDFIYTVKEKLFSFREVLLKQQKCEPRRVREAINVLLIRKRLEILHPEHFLSLKTITDSNDMTNKNLSDNHPVLAKRFRLHLNEIVGEGAFGTVIRATDLESDAKLAIKTFKADVASQTSKQEHINEINMLTKLANGPHIVSLISSGEADVYGMFMVFPYIESNLYDVIYELDITTKQIKSTMSMILEALNFMHLNDVVHRDLKPENILVDGDGIVSLCDFGLADTTNGRKLYPICGTRPYMSPEMVLSLGYTHSTDIWVSIFIFYSKFNLIFVINFNL